MFGSVDLAWVSLGSLVGWEKAWLVGLSVPKANTCTFEVQALELRPEATIWMNL